MPLEVEPRDLAGNPFRVGDWLVEPSLNRISRGDATIQLELKVMDVLVCLAERAGEVLTRQEIIDRVWATEFISDNTLTHADHRNQKRVGRRRKESLVHRDDPPARIPIDRAGRGQRFPMSQEIPRSRGSRFARRRHRRRRTAARTPAWPPSPKTTPSSSSAVRTRSPRCGASSPRDGCSR